MSKEEKLERLMFLYDAFGESILDALNSEDRMDVIYELNLRSNYDWEPAISRNAKMN
ncbi:MAG: hypothetical protein ABSF48_13030 [Thermodesulfobacteriota bacterium]